MSIKQNEIYFVVHVIADVNIGGWLLQHFQHSFVCSPLLSHVYLIKNIIEILAQLGGIGHNLNREPTPRHARVTTAHQQKHTQSNANTGAG